MAKFTLPESFDSIVASIVTVESDIVQYRKTNKESLALLNANKIKAYASIMVALVACGVWHRPKRDKVRDGMSNAFQEALVAATVTEASATRYWDNSMLALKEPKNNNGNLKGLLAVCKTGDVDEVYAFLVKQNVRTESVLRSIVAPNKTTQAQQVANSFKNKTLAERVTFMAALKIAMDALPKSDKEIEDERRESEEAYAASPAGSTGRRLVKKDEVDDESTESTVPPVGNGAANGHSVPAE